VPKPAQAYETEVPVKVLEWIAPALASPAIFDGRCLLAMGCAAPLTARRTLDFAFFGVVPFAAFLRAGLALAWPRFELFLRAVATRFFALAMIVPCEICRRQADLESSQLC
jgi:hypothetical protein